MWVGKLFDRRGSSVGCRSGRSPILLMLKFSCYLLEGMLRYWLRNYMKLVLVMFYRVHSRRLSHNLQFSSLYRGQLWPQHRGVHMVPCVHSRHLSHNPSFSDLCQDPF